MKKYPYTGEYGSPKKISRLTKFRLWYEEISEKPNFDFVCLIIVYVISVIPLIGAIVCGIISLLNYIRN